MARGSTVGGLLIRHTHTPTGRSDKLASHGLGWSEEEG